MSGRRRNNTQIDIPEDLLEKLLFIRIRTHLNQRETLLTAIREYADRYLSNTSVEEMRRVLDVIGEVHDCAGSNMSNEDAGLNGDGG